MDKDKLWRRGFVAVALWIVILLIIALLILSIYELVAGSAPQGASFLRDPQVIAIAIGLLTSVLFVERWKSLESKVDLMTTAQRESLDRLEKSVESDFKRRLAQSVGKAEALSAKISEILELHPWLEVITERDIFVETDSIRGIIRTCYSLLREEKYGHLFEYLEYHSRKGTSEDSREAEKKTKLRGTADDFLELAEFCETWLEDYYLSAQFLSRFAESGGAQGTLLMPIYLRRLLRIGDYVGAKSIHASLERKIYGETLLLRTVVWLGWPRRLPERVKWECLEALSLFEAASGEIEKANKLRQRVLASPMATTFQVDQTLMNAEFALLSGDWSGARDMLVSIEERFNSTRHLREAIYLSTQLGEVDSARWYRGRMTELRTRVFGDDESAVPGILEDDESEGTGDGHQEQRARTPARSPMWEKEMVARRMRREGQEMKPAEKSR